MLAENKGNFKNENGEYSGYIEIKNISDESINIKKTIVYLMMNLLVFKWQLPNIKLSKGEVLLIYTSGVSSNSGTLSTGFKLKNKNGTVVLTNNSGKVIDKVKYENLANEYGIYS
ncbi:MAG: lamin tail domain-containing protein [Clostridium sp.]|nr:MAG: lamin tail domain-containing protein [Clostridium sp.]